MGGYDELYEPLEVSEDAEYVYFTDVPRQSETWEIRQVAPRFKDPCLAAKIYKLLPHNYFPDTELTLWIDASIELLVDPFRIVREFLPEGKDIALFAHPHRDCMYAEAKTCIEMHKGDPKSLRRQVSKYHRAQYPEHYGLYACMFLLRRNNPAMNRFNEQWWSELVGESLRDQISYAATALMLQPKTCIIPGDPFNSTHLFRIHPHKRKG